ncbi:hypothetical protein RIR_jg23027.t1 [Rhizophagus irregularis DAOM 181602=DAOM 197198]|nr:hypothetical protein RIR_jg23027.t1 [Rhizophagus irregularis DAOM 181602=DAOM 197198]
MEFFLRKFHPVARHHSLLPSLTFSFFRPISSPHGSSRFLGGDILAVLSDFLTTVRPFSFFNPWHAAFRRSFFKYLNMTGLSGIQTGHLALSVETTKILSKSSTERN